MLCSVVYAQSSTSNGLQLPSSIQPGQLVVAQAPPNSMVKVGDKPVQVSDQGIFVFGVGRDATASLKIQLQQDKQTITHLVPIDSRQYKTDKITGVEKKYVSPPEDVLARIRQDNQQIGAARATNSDRTDFLAPIVWPATGRISGVYGSQRVFNGVPKRPHFGLDIANKTGSTVVAPWSGKVVLAVDDMYYSGGTLIIDHGFGVTSTYIHLSKITVEVGQEIKQGEKIAEIGATGRVTGPHLDWRINWFNERLDPALLFDLNGVAMNSQVKAKQKTLIKN
jgi:murein DD-endopeptidase MepM/ murein hydrolase activator NlpD